MDEKQLTNIKNLIKILIIICISVLIFFITYFTAINHSLSQYEKFIKNYTISINKINTSTGHFNKIDNNSILLVKEQLSLKSKELLKIKDSLKSLTPTENYKLSHENLMAGLDKNILMYNQICAILASPNSKDVNLSCNHINQYKNDCVNLYSKVNIKGSSISLNKNSLLLSDNVISYANQVYTVQRDREITSDQNTDFIKQTDEILDKFLTTKVDFSSLVIKARDDHNKYDEVLSFIDANEDNFSHVKKDFSKISVPDKALNCYNSLNDLLNCYELYIKDFRYALNNEKSMAASNALDKNWLKTCYLSSNKDINAVNEKYRDFLQVYAKFKSNSAI